jgi:GNAT superfamily N-acetyltransferase
VNVLVRAADPQGDEALALLAAAAREVRALYPPGTDTAQPGNAPTPARGAYLLACIGGVAVGSAALRPLDATTAEVRRLYVAPGVRRTGVARALLAELERRAHDFGYTKLRLETGNRQHAALALYAACGWRRIDPFGRYRDDPSSVCFEKPLA